MAIRGKAVLVALASVLRVASSFVRAVSVERSIRPAIFRRLAILVLPAVAAACGRERYEVPQAAEVGVTDDRGAPLAGAQIVFGARALAVTDERGVARLELTGQEGETFEVGVRCPDGYRGPSRSITIRRLRLEGNAVVRHSATCRKTRRVLVVAVRAENGPNLAILHLGKEIARTDESGAAHVRVEAEVGERLELVLSTEGMGEKVHPRNPSFTHEMGERDEVSVFQVTFRRDKQVSAPKARPRGPVRMD